jgi:hypothetical protein
MASVRSFVYLALIAATACASAGTGDSGDDDDDDIVVPDADPGGTPDASPPGTPDAPPGTPVPITLTQSTNTTTITAANSVSCNGGTPNFYHAENSYYRVFNLPAMGVTSAFTITRVDVGIEDATGTGGSQAANLKLYTLNGALMLANLTPIGTVPLTVTDQQLTVLQIPVPSTVVPAGSQLVVEFHTPDGQTLMNRFFVGSNALGESAQTFIRATACAVTEPTAVAVAAPGVNMHWVVSVTGTHIP